MHEHSPQAIRWQRASEVSIMCPGSDAARLTALVLSQAHASVSTPAVGIYALPCLLFRRKLSSYRSARMLDSPAPQLQLCLQKQSCQRVVRKIDPGKFQRLLESPSEITKRCLPGISAHGQASELHAHETAGGSGCVTCVVRVWKRWQRRCGCSPLMALLSCAMHASYDASASLSTKAHAMELCTRAVSIYTQLPGAIMRNIQYNSAAQSDGRQHRLTCMLQSTIC